MQTIPERLGDPFVALQEALDAVGQKIRVAIPGYIVSFNPNEGTAMVQPAIREKVKQPDGEVVDVTLPVLPDVPVCMPRAGGYALTLPVQAGDECLVVFADMCIDAWWASGGAQNQMEVRRHDLSDAFAILGPWSQAKRVANYPTDAAELRKEDGSAVVRLDATGVTISTTGNVSVQADGNATVQADGNVSVQAAGNANVTTTSGDINLSTINQVSITGLDGVTIQGKEETKSF